MSSLSSLTCDSNATLKLDHKGDLVHLKSTGIGYTFHRTKGTGANVCVLSFVRFGCRLTTLWSMRIVSVVHIFVLTYYTGWGPGHAPIFGTDPDSIPSHDPKMFPPLEPGEETCRGWKEVNDDIECNEEQEKNDRTGENTDALDGSPQPPAEPQLDPDTQSYAEPQLDDDPQLHPGPSIDSGIQIGPQSSVNMEGEPTQSPELLGLSGTPSIP